MRRALTSAIQANQPTALASVAVFVCVSFLTALSGCQSGPSILVTPPITTGDYLAGVEIPRSVDDESVQVVPVGVRIEPDPWDKVDGVWWMTLDLAIVGPADRVSRVANSLKYQFYERAPLLVDLVRISDGEPVRLDKTWYLERASNFVQFDQALLYEQDAGTGRIRALQPYRLALLQAPAGGCYRVSLDEREIRATLASLSDGLRAVQIDGSEHVFELRRASLHLPQGSELRSETESLGDATQTRSARAVPSGRVARRVATRFEED